MQGKAEDAGGPTPAKDDNAAMRALYPRTYARNSDDCYKLTMAPDQLTPDNTGTSKINHSKIALRLLFITCLLSQFPHGGCCTPGRAQ